MSPDELTTRVGQVIGTSAWRQIGQDRIDRFAAATDDFQFIHVDPVRARDSLYGRTVAHGFLTLSLLADLYATSCPEVESSLTVNYGVDRLRFLAPVRSGSRVRAIFRLSSLVPKTQGRWLQTMHVTVEIEGEERPAMVCEWLMMHFTQQPARTGLQNS